MSELKQILGRCKYCNIDKDHQVLGTDLGERFYVECMRCRARGPMGRSPGEAIESFNGDAGKPVVYY